MRKVRSPRSANSAVVGDDYEGFSSFPRQAQKEVDDRATRGRIEIAGWFVGKNNFRIVR